jgi:ubiquinone biosynthesis protein COQ4
VQDNYGLELDQKEANYLQGSNDPIAGSILISTSKYLNNPLFRDLFAQMGLKRDGHDLPGAYLIPQINKAFAEVTDVNALYGGLRAARESIPEFRDWLNARFVSTLSAATVKDYAPDTLGSRVHDFIVKSGMDIDFMFTGEPKDDYEYINKRRIQVHDIEHMVTGLDPSPVGEMALIMANNVAVTNYFGDTLGGELNRHGMFLVSTGLMRAACHYPSVVNAYVDGLSRGFALGSKQKKPLFMHKWEDYFEWTIPSIREEFGFQDGPPDGYWDWTFEAAKG